MLLAPYTQAFLPPKSVSLVPKGTVLIVLGEGCRTAPKAHSWERTLTSRLEKALSCLFPNTPPYAVKSSMLS